MPFELSQHGPLPPGTPLFSVDIELEDGEGGKAVYWPGDMTHVGDHLVPNRILYQRGGGDEPRAAMGIALIDGELRCVYLQFDANGDNGAVQDKHLKATHIEATVAAVAARVATPAVTLDSGLIGGAMTPTAAPGSVRAMQKLQRRRRNVDDPELMARVAAIYRANPDAPIPAIMRAEAPMSDSTAKRWVRRAADAGLLPAAEKKGKKRI
jgi:hypothetical protein